MLSKTLKTKSYVVNISVALDVCDEDIRQATPEIKKLREFTKALNKTISLTKDEHIIKDLGYAKSNIAERIKRHRANRKNKLLYLVKITHLKTKVTFNNRFQFNEENGVPNNFTYGAIKYLRKALIESIKIKRENTRKKIVRQKRVYIENIGYSVECVSGIALPGELKRALGAHKARAVFQAKFPKTKENHVGIELEFIASVDNAKLGTLLGQSIAAQYVHLKMDGSIRVDQTGYFAHELTACIPESIRDEIITEIIKVLRSVDARVNKSCGFHVHLDMRNRNRHRSFSNLVSAQSILYAMNPKSRQSNNYCMRTKTKVLDRERKGSRYKGVNAASLNKHGTIEIRIHSGTVDAEKIKMWIGLLISVVESQHEIKRAPRSIDTFCKYYNIPTGMRSYIIERIRKFNGALVEPESEVSVVA